MDALTLVYVMIACAVVFLVGCVYMAAMIDTPEERMENDIDQMTYLEEYRTTHERRQRRGQYRNKEAIPEEVQEDDGAA